MKGPSMSDSTSPAPLVDASWFLHEFVVPNYREFIKDQLSLLRAYNAAVSIAHMTDHIVIRGGGSKGQVGDMLKEFRGRSESFRQVEAMCNAFKHVYATGGGSRNTMVMTSTGMSTVETDTIVLVNPVDGEDCEYRLWNPLLVCDFNDNDRRRKLWVGGTLYYALRFVAQEVRCEDHLSDYDEPDQIELVRRLTTASRGGV